MSVKSVLSGRENVQYKNRYDNEAPQTGVFKQFVNNFVSNIFRHLCLPVFAWRIGSCYVFSKQDNSCEFLAFYGVITQSVIQSFLKTPVCGASLSYLPSKFD